MEPTDHRTLADGAELGHLDLTPIWGILGQGYSPSAHQDLTAFTRFLNADLQVRGKQIMGTAVARWITTEVLPHERDEHLTP